eukprot:TRINITY_DN2431_c0_g1_i7.p1 TRINITY_DN2431_c0_g1~~TRINITY_DN2431_c0_g1_i7.p1  ORF type:complete len:114 (+),score=8.80 TRINITY_DN2431_c0_g1_i7:328-669(+)
MVSKLKGISANFVVSFPAAFTFFTVYDGSKIALSNANIHPAYINLCSAAFGEIAQNIVRNPLEVCKQQMQIGLHKDIWETLRAVYRVKGNTLFVLHNLTNVCRFLCWLLLHST